MSQRWNHGGWWTGIGCALLLAVVTLSLARFQPPAAFATADKVQHLVAYFALMYWWGMVQPRAAWRWAIALPLLGLALEAAQSTLPHRAMEWPDAAANLAGVTLGVAALRTPAGRLIAWLDRRLGDRPDARGA